MGIIDGRSLMHTESAQRDASLLSPLSHCTLNDILVRLSLETTLWEAQRPIVFLADTHMLHATNFANSNDTGTAWLATFMGTDAPDERTVALWPPVIRGPFFCSVQPSVLLPP